MKTQATSSTFKLRVLPLEPAINTGCQLRSSDCQIIRLSQRKWRCLKGAVITVQAKKNSLSFCGVFLFALVIYLSD